jgi:peptidoglycan/LPS O-acetylase OafA/YrhL
MSAASSLYLDLLRFLAALAVFFAHLEGQPFTRHVLWWRLGQYGDTAVILFFVMSGYVIAHVTAERETSGSVYFANRASRMLSVSIVALLLTWLFDSAGSALRPDFYAQPWVLEKSSGWVGYLASLLFLNEYQVFQFGGLAPGSNGPYWSLSFEATYYLVVGLLMFGRKRVALPAAVLVLALAGKTIAALFPLWLLGFAAYRMRGPKGWLAHFLCWGSLLVVFAAPVLESSLPNSEGLLDMPWGRGPFNRNLVNDYVLAVAFTIHLVAARALLAQGCAMLERAGRTLRWLGALTFPLYLLHYPVLCLVSALSPWGETSWERATLISAVTALLVIALTPVCDRIKLALRTLFPRGGAAVRGNRPGKTALASGRPR